MWAMTAFCASLCDTPAQLHREAEAVEAAAAAAAADILLFIASSNLRRANERTKRRLEILFAADAEANVQITDRIQDGGEKELGVPRIAPWLSKGLSKKIYPFTRTLDCNASTLHEIFLAFLV